MFRGGGYWDRAGDCTASYRYWDNLDYRDGWDECDGCDGYDSPRSPSSLSGPSSPGGRSGVPTADSGVPAAVYCAYRIGS